MVESKSFTTIYVIFPVFFKILLESNCRDQLIRTCSGPHRISWKKNHLANPSKRRTLPQHYFVSLLISSKLLALVTEVNKNVVITHKIRGLARRPHLQKCTTWGASGTVAPKFCHEEFSAPMTFHFSVFISMIKCSRVKKSEESDPA